jgi:hypothetical protein
MLLFMYEGDSIDRGCPNFDINHKNSRYITNNEFYGLKKLV